MKTQTRLACLLLLWLPFAAAEYTYVPSEDYTDRANTSELAKISIRIYTGKTTDEYTTVLVEDAKDLLDKIDPKKPTVLYCFGWIANPETPDSVLNVLDAYLERQDHNILLADYSHIVGPDWDYTALSMRGIGYTLANALNELVAHGLNPETLHILGYSIGGQIPGYISRFTKFRVCKITALEPARIPYTTDEDHLSPADADFVTVIHTNPTGLGVDYSAGHADFWPNGKSGTQPGCEADELAGGTYISPAGCSHNRAPLYYVESLLNETAFLAVLADSYSSFANGSVSDTQVYMGYATPTTARGDFYLQTNRQAPFGRGAEGITFYEE